MCAHNVSSISCLPSTHLPTYLYSTQQRDTTTSTWFSRLLFALTCCFFSAWQTRHREMLCVGIVADGGRKRTFSISKTQGFPTIVQRSFACLIHFSPTFNGVSREKVSTELPLHDLLFFFSYVVRSDRHSIFASFPRVNTWLSILWTMYEMAVRLDKGEKAKKEEWEYWKI